ncbi:nucleotidyltransferase family protein [Bacillus sp. JJ1533]|uniref:nucleotidyltransferase family protein n=1 Tax=Bacillus sp. JJ1533 TaxID=3122959 RepID=UPI0030009E60
MAIELIRAIYDSTFPFPIDEKYYWGAIEDIEFFGISSQIYHLLKQNKQLEHTPPFFQERLKQKYTKALYQNLFIKNQTELILREFEKVGIEVIPLKGVWFAEKYFGHVGARGTSDIDLLVKPNLLDKAIECIKELRFTPDPKAVQSGFNLTFFRELPHSPIPLMVEIHWNIVDPKTSSLNTEKLWKDAYPLRNSNYIKELSDQHTFYMITLHGWRHNMNSLKYFLDILQLINNNVLDISYQKIFKEANKDKTLNRIIRTLSIVYNQFSFLDERKMLIKKKSILTWSYENLLQPEEKSIRKYLDFFDYQIFSFDQFTHSIAEIFAWIFPSKYLVETELKANDSNRSYQSLYIKLIKKRVSNFYKTIITHNS